MCVFSVGSSGLTRWRVLIDYVFCYKGVFVFVIIMLFQILIQLLNIKTNLLLRYSGVHSYMLLIFDFHLHIIKLFLSQLFGNGTGESQSLNFKNCFIQISLYDFPGNVLNAYGGVIRDRLYIVSKYMYFSGFSHSVLMFPTTRNTIHPDRRRQILRDESLETDSVMSQFEFFVQRWINLCCWMTRIGHTVWRLQSLLTPIRCKSCGVVITIWFGGWAYCGYLKLKETIPRIQNYAQENFKDWKVTAAS